MSLGYNIAFLVLDMIPMFLNYLNYHTYINMNVLDKTKSQKLFNMGQVNGVMSTVMFLLLANLFRLVG